MKLGIIFDVDGTLIDSMGRWKDAGNLFLQKMGCTDIEEDLHKVIFELSTKDTILYFQKKYLPNKSFNEISDGLNQIMYDFYKNEAELKPNARKLLDYLYDRNIEMVVATSTDRPLIDVAFDRFGMNHYFKKIYTATEFGSGKDKPEIYLDILKMLGTEPKNTWFFEDSLYAMKVAHNLGIKNYGVFDETCKENWEEIKVLADAYSVNLLENPDELCRILVDISKETN